MSDAIHTLAHGETITERRHAALELGTTHAEGVVDALVARLRDEPDGHVREDITWALVQHADEAEPQLLALLTSDRPHDRFSGAHVLSKIGDPAHFDAVAPLVGDAHADVALKAYRAAANTGGAGAADVLATRLGEAGVPALVAALESDDVDVRDHAVEALGYVGEDAAGAVDVVEAHVHDEHEPVRLTAVSALGQLGEAAVPALRRVAEGEDPVLATVARRFLDRPAGA